MIDLDERTVPPVAEPPQRPRFSAGRFTMGGLVVLAGAGWLVDITTDTGMRWGVFIPAALMMVGIGVMVGSQSQDVGGLIVIGVILTVLTFVSGAFNGLGPWDGVGQRIERPTTVGQVLDTYDHGIGDFTVDLRNVDFVSGADIVFDLGIGQGTVIVPSDVTVIVHAEGGIGEVRVFDRSSSGLGPSLDVTEFEGGPTIEITADVGIGLLEIKR